jgi:hypothetical protein
VQCVDYEPLILWHGEKKNRICRPVPYHKNQNGYRRLETCGYPRSAKCWEPRNSPPPRRGTRLDHYFCSFRRPVSASADTPAPPATQVGQAQGVASVVCRLPRRIANKALSPLIHSSSRLLMCEIPTSKSLRGKTTVRYRLSLLSALHCSEAVEIQAHVQHTGFNSKYKHVYPVEIL